MKHADRWTLVVMIAGSLPLAACGRKPATHAKEHPAEVERIEGSDLKRVTLTARAMERIDLKTDAVREQRLAGLGSPRRVVPYSSLIYDPQGRTWVYTSPQPGTFLREKVEVDRIDGDVVILTEGPPPGTVVASTGVAELYGTEFGVGH